ncbi:calcium homeostasis modulator protein 2-like [Xenia sp. Carnegie-2017]|uniref:calcium homeostasis modulator protein 2-like n=1 Tax=Xenia sp. Carnegie-2017 TaxID=2897299 RepID=UPI001F04D781|nr:calcium homeostasis modulator protein 2-like [Xenia sp. Carnegie-2017]
MFHFRLCSRFLNLFVPLIFTMFTKTKKNQHREALKNIVLICIVYVAQLILFKDIFRCPCRNHQFYGASFLFVPAILLFLLSLTFFERSIEAYVKLFKHKNYKTRCNYFLSYLVDIFRPFLASTSWITISLLRGESYVCIRAGPEDECGYNSNEITKENFQNYKIQSYIFGMAGLVSMVIFIAGIVCIERLCTTKDEYLPTKDEFLPTYTDFITLKKSAVAIAFTDKTKEIVKKHAQTLVENAFSNETNSEMEERFLEAREKTLNNLQSSFQQFT